MVDGRRIGERAIVMTVVVAMVMFVIAILLMIGMSLRSMLVMLRMRVAAEMEMGTTLTGRRVRTGIVAVGKGVAHHEKRYQQNR